MFIQSLTSQGAVVFITCQIFLHQRLAHMQQESDFFYRKILSMQLHYLRKALNIAPYRRHTVVGLPADLVVGTSLQPAADDLPLCV